MNQPKIDAVRHYFRLGWGDRIRLTKPGSKERVFKEHGPMTRFAIEQHIRRHHYDIALLVGTNVLVLDQDGANLGPFAGVASECVATARRGDHHWFRTDLAGGTNRIGAGGYEVDLIVNNNSIVGVPPSTLANGAVREWRTPLKPPEQLPLFPRHLYEQCAPKAAAVRPLLRPGRESLVKYIGHIEAVAGRRGHNSAFRCACRIAKEVEDVREGLAIFLAWNETNAHPPFDEKACLHKVTDAYKIVRGY